MSVTVLIADDRPVVREGLRVILDPISEITIVGECDNVADARVLLDRHQPKVFLMDPALSSGAGLDLISEVKQTSRNTRTLVLSDFDESVLALRALRAGAAGFLPKTASGEMIRESLLRVADGKLAYSESVLSALVESPPAPGSKPEDLLSNREIEVFTLLGRGLSPQDIATSLGIALATVYKHVANTKEKLGVSAGSSLTHFATLWLVEGRARAA